ncbi:MAG: tetratricopeptide repeat protein [Acidobacteria bacterium]|nr:tetratricopeptide repeat protein [Acidobacteriota bacterium]
MKSADLLPFDSRLLPVAFCLLISAFCLPAIAHEPLSERIVKLSEQIKKDPNNPNLYLKRGELHRLSRDWQAAQDDYDRAQKLNPQLTEVEFCRGRMWLEAGNPEWAKNALDRFLKLNPDRYDALLMRARAFEKMKDFRASTADYTRAIGLVPRAKPDHYIERARVQVAAGLMDEALQGLDEAILKLDQVVTLQLEAIEIELKRGNWDAALARLDKIAARSERKETLLARRGEILMKAGRKDEARHAFTAALVSIELLPPRLRQTKAMGDLEEKVQARLR